MKKGFFTIILTLLLLIPHSESLASIKDNTGQCIQECVQNYNPSMSDYEEDLFSVENFTAEQCVLFCKEGYYDGSCYFWEDGCCYEEYQTIDPDCQMKTWEKMYRGSIRAAQETTDGGFVLAGNIWSIDTSTKDIYLLKTDANGNKLWENTFGGINHDYGYSLQQTSDDGFIIVGTTSSQDEGWDIYLIKTDANGNITWENTVGGLNDDFAVSVMQTTEGGYIITGWTDSYGAAYREVYLIKTDANGEVLWENTFGYSFSRGYSVLQTEDGGYIISGHIAAGYTDVYLIKTDAGGIKIWEKTFGGPLGDYSYSMRETVDGGYIIIGYTRSFGAGGEDIYLIKTDSLGNIVWEKTFGGTSNERGFSVEQTGDGGYIITGETWSYGSGESDLYLIRTDEEGNIIWEKTFGVLSYDRGYFAQETSDGGFFIAGETCPSGSCQIYLIKTDAEGNVN